jgi:predicted nucleic acid binding AN1-type Zn finger protein
LHNTPHARSANTHVIKAHAHLCAVHLAAVQLLVRRFTAAGSSGRAFKQLPALYCDASTTDAELMDSHLNSMTDPLF